LTGTRDIEFKNASVANLNDATVTPGWYYFGYNKGFPTTCPLLGSCNSLRPYWTVDGKISITLFLFILK
jgi:hypothetical protein